MTRSTQAASVLAAILVGGAAVYWSVGKNFAPSVSNDETGPAVQVQPAAASPIDATAVDTEAAKRRMQDLRDEAEWATATALSTSRAVTRELVATDPETAAERSLDDPPSLQRLVAREWGDIDPEGLLRFGREHVGSERHSTFVHAAVRLQHRLEADAAKDWILGLPPGPARDSLLSTLLTAGGRHATAPPYVDAEVLAAFTDDAARQRAFLSTLHEVAEKDPSATAALIDEYALDPSTREQAEYILAAATGRRVFGTSFSFGR